MAWPALCGTCMFARVETGSAQAGYSRLRMAAHHSAAPPAPRSNGGSLGWIAKGQTVAEFEEAAFGCAPGALAMCETRFGVHLLTVTAER